ncbi:MAG: phosphoribosylformylglycinamidine cyclo-ligase [Actinomycetota bacterium]
MSTYENAGVNLDAADELIDRIGWRVTSTWTDDVIGGFGGFAAGLRVPPGYQKPVLMMSTDGVGTKAEIARVSGLVEGLGYDLLAMVADDLVAAGATPIAMQDYIAVGYLDVDLVERLVESITDACADNDVALLGGETAEHPGMLEGDRFDIAATALGIVELGDEVDNSRVEVGDVIVGVESPNLRSNGFSLVRALIVDQLDLDGPFPGSDRTVAETLLQPAVVYAPAVVNAMARVEPHGLAHITGGGLPGNVARILPEGSAAHLEQARWDVPDVFRVLQDLGSVADEEMYRTFNMGVGFVAVAAESDVDRLIKGFDSYDHTAAVIGRVVEGDGTVEIK